jgi:tRNA (guanine-N7-)-methyltransferase
MPHLHIKEFKKLDFPSELNSISFNFVAKNINYEGEILIATTMDNDIFFLLVNEQDDRVLLKTDKLTRPASTHSVHKALLSYAKLAKLEVLDSNVPDVAKNEHLEENNALKNIEYFASNFSTDKEIRIEVGFGSGRHLLHQATNNPKLSKF